MNMDFYKADANRMSITNEMGKEIKSFDDEFSEFGCLKKDKIKELSDYFRYRRLSKWER